jgi:hypothetical protein
MVFIDEISRIGIIDSSAGNGHMFSFTAAINGYEKMLLETCPFPVIRNYLVNYELPLNKLSRIAKVVNVWMPEIELAKKVASFGRINQVCESWKSVVEESDAVIITNDDPTEERAIKIAYALTSGKPVFVDKVLSLDRNELEQILKMQRYPGQLFAGSGVSYSPDFENVTIPGDCTHVNFEVPKSWRLYAVHALDLAFKVLGDSYLQSEAIANGTDHSGTWVTLKIKDGPIVRITASEKDSTPISILIQSPMKSQRYVLNDPLLGFAGMLEHWLNVQKREFSMEHRRYIKQIEILGVNL